MQTRPELSGVTPVLSRGRTTPKETKTLVLLKMLVETLACVTRQQPRCIAMVLCYSNNNSLASQTTQKVMASSTTLNTIRICQALLIVLRRQQVVSSTHKFSIT